MFENLLEKYKPLLRSLVQQGGRPLFVGGCVRDSLLHLPLKDIDIEVYGITAQQVYDALSKFGEVIMVGKTFGVFKVKGFPIDICLPRQDTKTAPGHSGFMINFNPELSFVEAFKRRDLTINSIGFDIQTKEFIDPYGGIRDLKNKVLRATNKDSFREDPLRILRAAQFAARFEMCVDPELMELSRSISLEDLSIERIYQELSKLLLLGKKPSLGFRYLKETGHLSVFPDLGSIFLLKKSKNIAAWEFFLALLDEAACYRKFVEDTEIMMLTVLTFCIYQDQEEDVSKEGDLTISIDFPLERGASQKVSSFLKYLRVQSQKIPPILALLALQDLVRRHSESFSPASLRIMTYVLNRYGLSMDHFLWLLKSFYGARKKIQDYIASFNYIGFKKQVASHRLLGKQAIVPVIQGADLIDQGYAPGPIFKELLRTCLEIQLISGKTDKNWILRQLPLQCKKIMQSG